MNEIISAFSAIFQTPVIIAGGAVRDSLLNREPKDYDVFILGQSWKEWPKFQKKLQDEIKNFPKIESKVTWHKSEPFLIESIMFEGKEIQILATPWFYTHELIETFDWGLCCFAYDGNQYTYDKADLEAIKEGEYLRLNKITYPFSTLRRGYRFSERFLMRLKRDDLKELTSQIQKSIIAAEAKENEPA